MKPLSGPPNPRPPIKTWSTITPSAIEIAEITAIPAIRNAKKIATGWLTPRATSAPVKRSDRPSRRRHQRRNGRSAPACPDGRGRPRRRSCAHFLVPRATDERGPSRNRGYPEGPQTTHKHRARQGIRLLFLFLVLLLIAVAAGIAAALGCEALPRRADPTRGAGARTPRGEPVRPARRTGPGRRGWLSARLDPDVATGLALTLALVVIIGGGLVLAGLAIVVRTTHGLPVIDTSVADWGHQHATAFSMEAGASAVPCNAASRSAASPPFAPAR